MASNNIGRVAKMYGLELNDKFKLKDQKNKILKSTFSFTENGLSSDNLLNDICLIKLSEILTGKYDVIKIKS